MNLAYLLPSIISGSTAVVSLAITLLKGRRHTAGHILDIGNVAYTPISLLVKPSKGFYSNKSLSVMPDTIELRKYTIEEDKSRQDYGVRGVK